MERGRGVVEGGGLVSLRARGPGLGIGLAVVSATGSRNGAVVHRQGAACQGAGREMPGGCEREHGNPAGTPKKEKLWSALHVLGVTKLDAECPDSADAEQG